MANEFKCPACSAPMTFNGGDSIFQTCQKCNAPIVIPSEVFYTKEQQIDAEDFATLAHDKAVTGEKVSIDVGAGEVANDDNIEEIINNRQGDEFASKSSEMDFASENIDTTASQNTRSAEIKKPSEAQLNQLYYLIDGDRKIEAIRFYRGIYGCDLHIAKHNVEIMIEQRAVQAEKVESDFPVSSDNNESILDSIRNELVSGSKINAIKIFLNSFDTSLAESKEVVDAMQAGKTVDISGFRRR